MPARLAALSLQDRRNSIAYLEGVAIMVASGMIRREIAHSVHGRYVAFADASGHLWHGLDKADRYADENLTTERQAAAKSLRF